MPDAIVAERHAFAETLAAVGPSAPTLLEHWVAHDIAAHVVSLDRFGGLPTFIGRSIVGRGVRLNDVVGRFADDGMKSTKRRGFAWAIEQLENRPPRLLLRESVRPVGVFEVFVHHEDVRRAGEHAGLRQAPEELARAVPWLLGYHRRRLPGIRLVVSTDSREWVEGTGSEATVRGPLAEVVLWLAGRRHAARVEIDGEGAPTLLATSLHI